MEGLKALLYHNDRIFVIQLDTKSRLCITDSHIKLEKNALPSLRAKRGSLRLL